jgi:hypothetical protein
MVTIKFKPMEVQELRLWGSTYKDRQKEVGMAWDDDQEKIMRKLKKAVAPKEAAP